MNFRLHSSVTSELKVRQFGLQQNMCKLSNNPTSYQQYTLPQITNVFNVSRVSTLAVFKNVIEEVSEYVRERAENSEACRRYSIYLLSLNVYLVRCLF